MRYFSSNIAAFRSCTVGGQPRRAFLAQAARRRDIGFLVAVAQSGRIAGQMQVHESPLAKVTLGSSVVSICAPRARSGRHHGGYGSAVGLQATHQSAFVLVSRLAGGHRWRNAPTIRAPVRPPAATEAPSPAVRAPASRHAG